MRRLPLLAAILAALSVAGASASAAGPPLGWGLRPADSTIDALRLRIEAGGSASASALALSALDEPTQFEVWPVGVVTGQRGGLSYADEPDAAAAWIQTEAQTVDLTRSAPARIPIRITVPESTAPGEYVLGLAMARVDSLAAARSDAPGIVILTRSAMPIYVNVPGPTVCDLRLDAIDSDLGPSGNWGLILRMTNAGNVGVTGSGALMISGPDGDSSEPLALGYSVAGKPVIYPTYRPAPKPGDYAITAAMSADGFADCGGDIARTVTLTPPEIERAKADARAAALSAFLVSLLRPPGIIWALAAICGLLGFGLLGYVGAVMLRDRLRRGEDA